MHRKMADKVGMSMPPGGGEPSKLGDKQRQKSYLNK
jgi:hypothetical protein